AVWNVRDLDAVPYATTKREGEMAVLGAAQRDLPPEVVVVNPGCVVGPDDPGPSEFGQPCRRFWKGRIPIFFGGGNNFVDVRYVAAGHLLAAERGQPGRRYILGGENLRYGAFFTLLARVAGRRCWSIGLPGALAPWVAALERRLRSRPGVRPHLTA